MGRYPNVNFNMSAQQAYMTNDFGYFELCMVACLIVTYGFWQLLAFLVSDTCAIHGIRTLNTC